MNIERDLTEDEQKIFDYFTINKDINDKFLVNFVKKYFTTYDKYFYLKINRDDFYLMFLCVFKENGKIRLKYDRKTPVGYFS